MHARLRRGAGGGREGREGRACVWVSRRRAKHAAVQLQQAFGLSNLRERTSRAQGSRFQGLLGLKVSGPWDCWVSGLL